jgi:hypothetical protein
MSREHHNPDDFIVSLQIVWELIWEFVLLVTYNVIRCICVLSVEIVNLTYGEGFTPEECAIWRLVFACVETEVIAFRVIDLWGGS